MFNSKGKPNQSEIARESGMSRPAARRIGRLYEARGLWLGPKGQLLLGNGTDFRAAGDTVSLKELEEALGLEPFAK